MDSVNNLKSLLSQLANEIREYGLGQLEFSDLMTIQNMIDSIKQLANAQYYKGRTDGYNEGLAENNSIEYEKGYAAGRDAGYMDGLYSDECTRVHDINSEECCHCYAEGHTTGYQAGLVVGEHNGSMQPHDE